MLGVCVLRTQVRGKIYRPGDLLEVQPGDIEGNIKSSFQFDEASVKAACKTKKKEAIAQADTLPPDEYRRRLEEMFHLNPSRNASTNELKAMFDKAIARPKKLGGK